MKHATNRLRARVRALCHTRRTWWPNASPSKPTGIWCDTSATIQGMPSAARILSPQLRAVPCKEKHRARSLETSGKCRLAPACTPSELHPGGGKAAEGDVGSRFVVSIAFEVGQGGVGIRLSVSSPSNTGCIWPGGLRRTGVGEWWHEAVRQRTVSGTVFGDRWAAWLRAVGLHRDEAHTCRHRPHGNPSSVRSSKP